jgi:gluconate kinase
LRTQNEENVVFLITALGKVDRDLLKNENYLVSIAHLQSQLKCPLKERNTVFYNNVYELKEHYFK